MENNNQKTKTDLITRVKCKYSWLNIKDVETTFNMALSDYLIIKFPSDNNRPSEESFNYSDFVVANWIYKRMIDILDRAGGTNVTAYSENNLRFEYGGSYIDNKLVNQILPRAGVPR